MKLHDLAVHITNCEGGQRVLNIGDVKEVLRLLAVVFAEEDAQGESDSWENFRAYALQISETLRPEPKPSTKRKK